LHVTALGRRLKVSAVNDLPLLLRVLAMLRAAGLAPLVSGGWAEELLRLVEPRVHRDIDLLLSANSFAGLDRLLAEGSGAFAEIRAKRFAHKRAFLFEGVMVELTLVESGQDGPVTLFWGDVVFRWLTPLAAAEPLTVGGVSVVVVSVANLMHYRQMHHTTEPWRWKDAGVLVS
jgi:hypothetical protein